ncbi:unnamed protein product [Caenorhabditis brenneri]
MIITSHSSKIHGNTLCGTTQKVGTSFLTKLCGRKTRRQDKIKPSNEDQPHPSSDPNYYETQENIQTVEVQEDLLANVRLLTPTLPGGCNDENAAKEAATRHKTPSVRRCSFFCALFVSDDSRLRRSLLIFNALKETAGISRFGHFSTVDLE